jgi:hypothetical protein
MKRIEQLIAFGGYKDRTFMERTLASECNKLEQWYFTFLNNMKLNFECAFFFVSYGSVLPNNVPTLPSKL